MSSKIKATLESNKLMLLGTTAMVALFMSPVATAQEAAPAEQSAEDDVSDNEDDEIVVKGIRQSLRTARDMKREADTFVDSITSSDVSTLPDLSVAEALQRVPGVTVTRFQSGGSNADFPSPEGAGNLIRGLGFIRSEFNGRDAFTANGGRALDWASIPSELVGGVDVYKNQSADLIEGGIGGTINLRTLEPFDRDGLTGAVILETTYADLREEWSPGVSAILGNRWQTEAGEFGLLGSYSSSDLSSEMHGYQVSPPIPRAGGGDNGENVAYVPGFQLRTNKVDRERESYYLAAQWRSPDDSLLTTFKYARVENLSDGFERTTEWFPDANTSQSLKVSDLTLRSFKSDGIARCNGNNEDPIGDCDRLVGVTGGLMQSGVVTDESNAWYGGYGVEASNLAINAVDESTTEDFSMNIKYRPNDKWYVSLDAHKTKADASFRTLWGGSNFFTTFFTRPDLDNPVVKFMLDPRTKIASEQLADPTPSSTPTSTADPSASWLNFAADQFRNGSGDLFAMRGDAEYEFDSDSWFESVKFGARYSEREQLNQETALNWAGVSPAWNGGIGRFSEFDTVAHEIVDFSGFFGGGVVQGNNTSFVYVAEDLLRDYNKFVKFIENEPDLDQSLWRPLADANGKVNYSVADTSDIIEKTQNYYVRFDFGRDFDNGMSIDGNFGVRYVTSTVDSAGQASFDPFDPDLNVPSTAEKPRTADAEGRDDPRDFLPETAAYLDGAATDIVLNQEDEFWLPSFNMKLNLNDDSLLRFGVSKGMTRPNIQDIRASQRTSAVVSRTPFAPVPAGDPLFGIDRGAQNISLAAIRVSGGNPNLKPTTAVSVDISYEHYFGDDGFFTFAVFAKDLENIQRYGDDVRGTITLDGQTVPLIFSGVVNQDKAEIRGFEVAYQQFFDELPGAFSNLGFQANYTYVDASATPPTPFADANGDGVADTANATFRFGVSDLLGQSDHTANLVGIYQDDKLEARLAYNWRSDYLNSYRDFVTGNPIYQEEVGFLDASFKYDFTEKVQVRFQAANLLDTKSKATNQIDKAGQRAIRQSFINDRRFEFGVRYQF